MALDIKLDRRGVEGLFVLELDTCAELDDEPSIAVRPLPFGGQLGNDLQLGTDIDELVAHGGEDDATDVASGKRRVEDIGVFGETDPQSLGRDCSDQCNHAYCDQEIGRNLYSQFGHPIPA